MILAAGWLLGLRAWAAEPVLGPEGWRALGPTAAPLDAADDPLDGVRFEPRTCIIEDSRVDLDAGPGARDVRLARVFEGGAWRWLDDWSVTDGVLVRPGRLPLRLGPGLLLGGERLVVDAFGGVIERQIGGRRIRVLRDDGGRFVGMADGSVEVRWVSTGADTARASATDGRVVEYRYSGPRLVGVTTFVGAQTTYSYGPDGALTGVMSGDGATLTLAREPLGSGWSSRVEGDRGRWSCRVTDGRTRVTSPTGAVWGWDLNGVSERLTDPTGVGVKLLRRDGWLAGWTDPRGSGVELGRDAEKRVVSVRAAGGGVWGFDWSEGGLVRVGTPDGGSWSVARDGSGARSSESDPAGRSLDLSVDSSGRLIRLLRGGGRWGWRRDERGRVDEIADPVAGEVKLRRDGLGRVSQVVDGAGGLWRVTRSSSAEEVSVTDPVGGEWLVGRDGLGRARTLRDPTGRRMVVSWDRAGWVTQIDRAGAIWHLVRDLSGGLLAVDGPERGRWSALRDAAGRPERLYRPDGSELDLRVDEAGDLVGIGSASVSRDSVGRPVGVRLGGARLIDWDRDVSGSLVGVTAPGVSVGWERGPDRRLLSVSAGDAPKISLAYDSSGRLTSASTSSGRTLLRRDPAGRVVGIGRERFGEGGAEAGPRLDLIRDRRGLVGRVRWDGADVWSVRRDPAGRVLSVESESGVRLGVDRDPAGRPTLVRYPDGGVVHLTWGVAAVDAQVLDPGGRVQAILGWGWDGLGRLVWLRANGLWTFHRDPAGTLVALESDDGDAWSRSPGRIDLPGGGALRLSAGGARVMSSEGVGVSEVADSAGALVTSVAPTGTVRYRYDPVGRLAGWEDSKGWSEVVRDELGRIVSIGGRLAFGWEGWWSVGGGGAVALPGIAAFGQGEAALFGPTGSLVWSSLCGPTRPSPTGIGGEAGGYGAGGWLVPLAGGPGLGLLEGVDRWTGGPLSNDTSYPWRLGRWEVTSTPTPWPDPDAADAAGAVPWDDAPLASASRLADPLAVLVAGGDLPSPGQELGTLLDRPALRPQELRTPGAGIPWLPASVRPSPPAPLLDPDLLVLDEEPIVRWVLAHATAPVLAAEPESLSAWLWGPVLAEELPVLAPGLEDGGDELRRSLGIGL